MQRSATPHTVHTSPDQQPRTSLAHPLHRFSEHEPKRPEVVAAAAAKTPPLACPQVGRLSYAMAFSLSLSRTAYATSHKLKKKIPTLPIEVLASVLGHLENDRKTLKKVSLASRNLCFLAQELLFSTINITQSTSVQKFLQLESILLSSPRGANIVLGIRTLSFRSCSKLLVDPKNTALRVLQFIADHAKRLRAVHFGPFFPVGFLVWNFQNEELGSILVRLFTMAEEIMIEGVCQFPASLFSKLGNLKHLDFSASYVSLDSTLEPSLTLHGGVLGHDGSLIQSLPTFGSLELISFANLRVLYLYTPLSPGRNALYRDLICLCDCKRLESLRFYIEGDDLTDPNIDDPVINLSLLTSLRSLYVIVNVNDSLGCLASTVNTLSLPQTHLKELVLFIDTGYSNMEEDFWLEEMMIEVERHSESWKSLDSKLAQIFKAWDDTQVVIQFPPVDPVLNEEVHYFVEDQLSEISEYMHRRFYLLDLNFRNIVAPHLSFREDENQARILEDSFPNRLFSRA